MKVALVGIGKIAVDQHVPSIQNSGDWELGATVSRSGIVAGVPAYTDLETMLAENADIEVISLCLPPVPRFDYAAACIRAGRHVMLEKPPGATLSEVNLLENMANEAGVVLFATWHSRMAKGVAAAKVALSGKTIQEGHIDWKEDVRKWHPGQDWVWEPGGMGVLDPGINALSILTEILPTPVHLRHGVLHVPSNRQTPVSAELAFSDSVTASFDWLNEGQQLWEMHLTATDGTTVLLKDGGNTCVINDKVQAPASLDEYPALYARMRDLIKNKSSDVDLAPMVHVSDIMTLSDRKIAPSFDW